MPALLGQALPLRQVHHQAALHRGNPHLWGHVREAAWLWQPQLFREMSPGELPLVSADGEQAVQVRGQGEGGAVRQDVHLRDQV